MFSNAAIKEEGGTRQVELYDLDAAFHELLMAQDLSPLKKFELRTLPLLNERPVVKK